MCAIWAVSKLTVLEVEGEGVGAGGMGDSDLIGDDEDEGLRAAAILRKVSCVGQI